jgi:membrane protease YdiL (CAAX protease family)
MAIETADHPGRRSWFAAACEWTPVQLLVLFAALAAIDVACQIAGGYLVHHVPAAARDLTRVGSALVLASVMVVAYRWLVGTVERRVVDELGKSSALTGLATGAAAGAALFIAVYAILWIAGAIGSVSRGGAAGLAAALAVAIASAAGEEIVFRGVVFRLLEKALGTTIALVLSAGAFGLIHAGNAGATWVSTLAIALESGVLLAVIYTWTRSLWLPIGLHFGWNFTEGGIFGAAVSGGRNTGLIVAPLSGPPTLTGGEFGPEASIVAMAVSLLASAVLIVLARRAGQWRRPRLRLRLP